MKSTSRLRVLSDRIPRVLVFVYFCRGLSGNTEERPTRRDYIEILTCRAIILHLEESRSHGNERKGDRVLTVLNAHIYPSTNHGKGSKCNQHPDLGFYLTEFHEFWCLSISAGGYQEIRKKGPHVGFT